MVTSDKGCVNTKTLPSGVRTKLGGAMVVPNAFIPSNIPEDEFMVEDKNKRSDIFYPLSEGVREIKLEIFNRWGKLIFFSDKVNKGWNGWENGKQCKSDVYVYKVWALFSDGRSETRVGDVTLIR
jgi:gliding motility-associated-like protein